MLNFLNRLAWISSVSTGFIITFFLGLGFDVIDDDVWFLWLIFTIGISMAFKNFILPLSMITEICENFNLEKTPIIKDNLSVNPANSVSDDNDDYLDEKEEEIFMIDNSLPTLIHPLDRNETEKPPVAVTNKPINTPKEPNFIQKFFAENLLAKIGGILLFLGVLFLLQLVYSSIGPVAKIIIGFIIGFSVFGVGVWLDSKKLFKESQILLGTGILINYLVILSGRFLIGDNIDNMYLSEGLTFFLLIFNTIFAVLTSLIYKSSTLLFFSFVIAYLNPFLIGADASETPYTLGGYSLIVSFGAIALSIFTKPDSDKNSQWLLHMAIFGGNLLILIAPFNSTTGWLIKLILMAILSLSVIIIAYFNEQEKNLFNYFALSYLFLIGLLMFGANNLGNLFQSSLIFTAYTAYLLIFIAISFLAIIITSAISVFYLLIFPLIIILGLIFSGSLTLAFIVPVLLGSVLVYLLIYSLLWFDLPLVLQYLFWGVLGCFIFFISLFLGIDINHLLTISLSLSQNIGIMITTGIFLLATYYFASKKNLAYLYSLGTFASIFMLLPIITREGEFTNLSAISVIILVILNIIQPFINSNLVRSQIYNLVIGLVLGVLFGAGEIYYFGEKYFSGVGVELGLSFLGLAIVYFVLAYFMFQKLEINFTDTNEKNEQKLALKNAVYTLMGISISLFSLAIAFVFSNHSEVISAVWLFEASLMFFFYQQTKDIKIYLAGIILMLIGFIKLTVLLPLIQSKDFLSLVPLTIIFMSLIANLKFLDFKKEARFAHDALHIFCVIIIGILLLKIIPSHGHGWSILGISAFSLIPAFIYTYFYSGQIKHIFVASLIIFFIHQITSQDYIYYKLDNDKISYLKSLQYVSTALLGTSVFIYYKFLNLAIIKNKEISAKSMIILIAAFALYLFVITSQYVYDIFAHNEFGITIYWGIMAFIFLSYGIQKNIIKFRTLGLYILTLTVSKILIYDIWSGLDNAMVRVVALMVVGILMIIISIFYSKKYDGQLKGEFSWQNFGTIL